MTMYFLLGWYDIENWSKINGTFSSKTSNQTNYGQLSYFITNIFMLKKKKKKNKAGLLLKPSIQIKIGTSINNLNTHNVVSKIAVLFVHLYIITYNFNL